MKLGRVALLLAAATALQFFVGGSRHRGAWPVDCFLIATAVVARGGNPSRAVLVGGALGFLEDAFAHELLGMNAFAKAADDADVTETTRCNALPTDMKERPNFVDRLGREEDAMKARIELREAATAHRTRALGGKDSRRRQHVHHTLAELDRRTA